MTSRNTLSVFHSLPWALCLLATPLSADTSGPFTYSADATSITLTGCDQGATGALSIPAKIAGKPVTTIAAYAFSSCTGLTAISLPASVTTIAGAAFNGCSALTDFSAVAENPSFTASSGVLFDKTLTTLVVFPAGRTGTYKIPSGVTTIATSAFSSCNQLTHVSLPAGLKTIGDSAFDTCTALPGLTFPQSLTTIGTYVFRDCYGFTSITLPPNVSSVGEGAFIYCSNLKEILADPANPYYSSKAGVLFDKKQKLLVECPGGLTGNYTVPTTVTTIGTSAFGGTLLSDVTITNNVTSILSNVFVFSPNLTRVTFPAKLTNISTNAFLGCNNLALAVFLGNAPTMGTGVFDICAAGFNVRFIMGMSGFTHPTWQGYPCSGMMAKTEIDVQSPVGTSLVDATTTKNFGKLTVGITGTAKTFTIRNTGSADLTGLAVTIDGPNRTDFTHTAPGKTTLVPGASTTFKVSYKPSATGTRGAFLHITSNDADENPFDITLTGKGTAP